MWATSVIVYSIDMFLGFIRLCREKHIPAILTANVKGVQVQI